MDLTSRVACQESFNAYTLIREMTHPLTASLNYFEHVLGNSISILFGVQLRLGLFVACGKLHYGVEGHRQDAHNRG